MKLGRRGRWLLIAILACAVGPPAGFVAWRYGASNFGTLQPGRLYRSGQMSAASLKANTRALRLKSVLNLRGVNEGEAWYRNELAATTSSGATQLDFKMASDQWLSRAQLRSLIHVLDSCEYPLLIHCEFGSERTGLVSAITELLRPDGGLDSARTQFSTWYLYRRDAQNKVLPAHLDQYEAWLASRGEIHTPDRFRQWAVEAYAPGQPSREYWPYNPDPLVVVTHPGKPVPTVGALPDHARR